MRSRAVLGLAITAALVLLATGIAVQAGDVAKRADLTGRWRLDPKRSDAKQSGGQQRQPGGGGGGGMGGPGGGPPGGGGGGGFGGGPPGGGGGGFGGGPPSGGGGGFGGSPPGGERGGDSQGDSGSRRGGGPPPRPLPDLMHVTDTERLISFEDSTGVVLQEITILATETEKDTLAHAPGAQVLQGRWKDAKLDAKHTTRGGMKVTQSITVQGDTALVVRTKIDGGENMPSMESKRFYRRVKGD